MFFLRQPLPQTLKRDESSPFERQIHLRFITMQRHVMPFFECQMILCLFFFLLLFVATLV